MEWGERGDKVALSDSLRGKNGGCFTIAPCGFPLSTSWLFSSAALLQGAGASSWKVRELGGEVLSLVPVDNLLVGRQVY